MDLLWISVLWMMRHGSIMDLFLDYIMVEKVIWYEIYISIRVSLNVSHMNSHIYMNYNILQNVKHLNVVRILLFLVMCICNQIQIINMHTSRGSLPHTLKYLASIIFETSILLQIIVLSSNTKRGEIERTSSEFMFLILVLCVS